MGVSCGGEQSEASGSVGSSVWPPSPPPRSPSPLSDHERSVSVGLASSEQARRADHPSHEAAWCTGRLRQVATAELPGELRCFVIVFAFRSMFVFFSLKIPQAGVRIQKRCWENGERKGSEEEPTNRLAELTVLG